MALNQNVQIIIGCVGGLFFIALCAYLAFKQYHRFYPQFTPLPGPFKCVAASLHRMPHGHGNCFKIFYPTSPSNIESSNSKHPNTYFTSLETMDQIRSDEGIPQWFLNSVHNLQSCKHPIPYYVNAPIAVPVDDELKYPLVVFSHGNRASMDLYTQLCCGLASYGMIVVIADHTDCSALYTKIPDDTKSKLIDLFYETTHDPDGTTGTTYDDDVSVYGQRRLKAIRVPEMKALYEYLRSDQIEDDSLNDILSAVDFENVVFGGQSFGGTTSWMTSREFEDEGNLKCLLLWDPWFGCLEKSELQNLKWSLPAYIMSSEKWATEREYLLQCTEKVMRNGSHLDIEWEYAKRSVHMDFSDIPLWGPSLLTKSRSGYTAQEWNDLMVKRAMSFVVQQIPKMKQWVNKEHLEYDRRNIERINFK